MVFIQVGSDWVFSETTCLPTSQPSRLVRHIRLRKQHDLMGTCNDGGFHKEGYQACGNLSVYSKNPMSRRGPLGTASRTLIAV